jgi:hypothetical protein
MERQQPGRLSRTSRAIGRPLLYGKRLSVGRLGIAEVHARPPLARRAAVLDRLP